MSSLCEISAVTELITVIVLYCTVQCTVTVQVRRTVQLYTALAAPLGVGTYKVAAALIMMRGDTEYLHQY